MGKRGPAPKGEYVNKSKVLSTRIREDTRLALAAAAKKSGRSLSQEIEHRLRRSFDFDSKVSEAFGDEKIYALMRIVASVMAAQFNPNTEGSWTDDPYAFDQAARAVNAVLEAIRPQGETQAPDLGAGWTELAAARGNSVAAENLLRIADAPDELPIRTGRDRSAFIKSGLGHVAKRIENLASRDGRGTNRIVRGTAADMRKAAAEMRKEGKK